MIYCQSIKKTVDELTNEDSASASEKLLVVSDGAGGGGIYADKWSKYLVENIPESPICTLDELDAWVGNIWKPFYDEYEAIAKEKGGLVLRKFYEEGSFATLAAIWPSGKCAHWMTYGDSVVFCYNWETHSLDHSPIRLIDFADPPYLISSVDPLQPEGFKRGVFDTEENCWLFVASDALSHCILAAYMTDPLQKDRFDSEVRNAVAAQSRNSQFVQSMLNRPCHNFESFLKALKDAAKSEKSFRLKMEHLRKQSELGLDDYSLSLMVP